jgi:mRNA (2'-O-methyladenosine-N6-)-methyltransferase
MSTTMETLADINDLLAAHTALTTRVRATQKSHRETLRSLPSPPHEILELPLIRNSSPSPSPSPTSPSSRVQELQHETERDRDPHTRTDLPLEKRVRLARYAHYVPEEETFRNDYSQRYVDSGDWPQNWVLGAELDKRFEESVHVLIRHHLLTQPQISKTTTTTSSKKSCRRSIVFTTPLSPTYPFTQNDAC